MVVLMVMKSHGVESVSKAKYPEPGWLVRNPCRMKRQKPWTANVFTAALCRTVFLRVTSFSTQVDNCEIALPPPKNEHGS